jgi:hypothetical protein
VYNYWGGGNKIMSNLFNPEISWLEQLPSNLRPDIDKVKKLENLRFHYHIPNDIFIGIITSSPEITRRVQGNVYKMAKEKMPNASEKEVLKAVFRTRVFPQNPAGLKLTEEEICKVIQNINSLNDLVEYFIQKDKEEPRFQRDILGIGKKIADKIDSILKI